ncbi:LuxR C-terminal-related transcriptional regulator [Streptomyces turgidiscabies]|uniref:LuxR C-terminal-related transcriptional regulator n=1 Tax=Streptomyces TaxID=1883 RepID=UPI00389A1F9D
MPTSDSDFHSPPVRQELRVVPLAAEGLTNREIGTQLLISPRTVTTDRRWERPGGRPVPSSSPFPSLRRAR